MNPTSEPARPDDRTYFCPVARGLEPVLADELQRLGARDVRIAGGGVHATGPLALAYRINMRSRLASRVLLKVADGHVRDEQALYRLAFAQPWAQWFTAGHTLRVDLTAVRSPWRSLNFATLRIKDGVCDQMREAVGERPSIDTAQPDVRVQAFVEDAHATLYLDLSGEPLFKRGWRAGRDAKGEAPLKETLAAGLLALSGWTPEQPLIDPFCGSGTILVEAAQTAAGIAPGLRRDFALDVLALHDPDVADVEYGRALALREAAAARAVPMHVAGFDHDPRMIERARRNLVAAGLGPWLDDGAIVLGQARAEDLQQPAAWRGPAGVPGGVVLGNPPYGERIPMPSDTWKAMGQQLRAAFGGWRAAFITSDRTLPGQLGLRERRKTPLFNGAIECRLFEFGLRRPDERPAR